MEPPEKPKPTRKKNKIPKRKQTTHRKRHKKTEPAQYSNSSNISRSSLFSPTPSDTSNSSLPGPTLSDVTHSMPSHEEPACNPQLLSPTLSDVTHSMPSHEEPACNPPLNEADLQRLSLEVRSKLFLMLPEMFVPLVANGGIHVLMVGRRPEKAVQRQIMVSSNGDVRAQVHGVDYPALPLLEKVLSQVSLSEATIGQYTDRIVQIVSNLRALEICAGVDSKNWKEAWPEVSQGSIDNDTFKECRYRETLRSKKCLLLVNPMNWRCKECTKMYPIVKRKYQSMNATGTHKNTNARYLTKKHINIRLEAKEKKIRQQKQVIDRLTIKMKEMLKGDSIKVEENLAKDVEDILRSANLSPKQSLFLQQQLKFASCKKACGMRWHPTLIRMALSLYLKAPGAYKDLCDSGFIQLPTARTLFDYSHVTKVKPGIDEHVLESAAKRATSKEHTHKQYHVLMADEIHISKNIVLLKSTGELVGFTDLDVLDQEVGILEAHLDNPEQELETKKEPELATKVMAFMIKGVSSSLKHVVASYATTNPSPKQMYQWTWDVIGALERNGVMVIAFVCDGAPTNRAFIKMHTPVTITASGVVFDTINKYAPDRILYFFSDVPHLLKTIRNAFYNSRKNPRIKKKSPRLLKKNGQYIVWDTIIRLFHLERDKVLRLSYKLNAQNVFPDSYSRMKVKPAAQVMSHTVATDILGQGWAGTSETVNFIYKVNDWFDLMNGASSTHGIRTNNRRLNPYTMQDVLDFENGAADSRFREILDFVQYLDEWKNEVNTSISRTMSLHDDLGVGVLPDEGSFHELDDSQTEKENEEPSAKNFLPHQTHLGIEMSCRSFVNATTFLLKEGVTFINARVFCQDPLEQNFGRQRMAGGGSSNPNLYQFLHKQRGFSTIGELSAANKRGNTEVVPEENVSEISAEPLPKRQRNKKMMGESSINA